MHHKWLLCMVSEIWRVTDNFFCHFGLIFAPWTQKTKSSKKWKKHLDRLSDYTCKPQMTIIWGMVLEIWSAADKMFCHLDRFLPIYPTHNPKNQNFEKMKKITGDIIILHMCTINENHMMYGSWDMECDRQNVLSF